MTGPQVLLLTHSQDHFTIDRVHHVLAARGARVLRVDTDRLPWESALSWSTEGDGRLALRQDGHVHDLSAVKAVWVRRLWPGVASPEGASEGDRQAAAVQTVAALDCLEAQLGHAAWMNPPAADRRASDKPIQLARARAVGLTVPDTLISNDGEAIRAFAARQAAPLIVKALRPMVQAMEGRPDAERTRLLSQEEIGALAQTLPRPAIYQPFVPKARELRVVLAGGELWAGALDATRTETGAVDWRATAPQEAPGWEHAQLPDDVAERLFALRDDLGLGFGVVDLIVTPEGEHVFLELNPAGEWGMLERELDLPISRAIARWLMEAGELAGLAPRVEGQAPGIAPAPKGRRVLPAGAPTVLINTMSNDNESVEMVADALRHRGARPIRLDTDRYPTELGLGSELGARVARSLRLPTGEELDLSALTSVWNRRYRAGGRLPRQALGDTYAACMGEARRTLHGTLGVMPCFKLDPYESVRRADHKELQLRRAAEVGLAIPDTLITNRADEVRAFFEAHPQGIITKMQHSFAIYREGEEHVVFTNPVGEGDLGRLDGLRFSPMTFQANIQKRLEIRATVIGDRVFSAAVDSASNAAAKTDWRRDGSGLEYAWAHHTLPDDVAARLVRLVGEFGLNYSAADLILTPEGEYVFLEINAAGEFFWLQHAPGLPMVEQLADVLLGLAPRNPVASQHAGGVPLGLQLGG